MNLSTLLPLKRSAQKPSSASVEIPFNTSGRNAAQKPTSRRWWAAKIAKAALGVIIFALLAEGSARVLATGYDWPMSHDRLFDKKFVLATRPVKDESAARLFLMGDSTMTFAVIPEVVDRVVREAGLWSDARNLASPGNSPVHNLSLVKAAVQAGVAPNYVLYGISPKTFSALDGYRRGNHPLTNHELPNTYLSQCLTPAFGKQTWQARLDCQMQGASYLYRYRSQLKSLVLRLPELVSAPDPVLLEDKLMHFPINEISWKGWVPMNKYPEMQGLSSLYKERNERYIRGEDDIPTSIQPFEWDDSGMAPLVAFCQQNNIPLYLVMLPEAPWPELYYQVRKTTKQAFMARVQQYVAAHTGVELIRLDEPSLVPVAYGDDVHLNPLGTVETSNRLAERMLPVLQAARLRDEQGDL